MKSIEKKDRELYGMEAISGLRDFFQQEPFLKQSQLVIASSKRLSHLASFLKLKPPSLPWFELPPFFAKQSFSKKNSFQRMSWQKQAQTKKGLFLASPLALLKKTPPSPPALILKKGKKLPPLESWGYISQERVSQVGECSFKMGVCDVFSPYYTTPLRFYLVGENIESCFLLNKEGTKRLQELSSASLPLLKNSFSSQEDLHALCLFLKKEGHSQEHLRSLARGKIPFGWEGLKDALSTTCSLDFLEEPFQLWLFEPELLREEYETEKKEFSKNFKAPFSFENIFLPFEHLEKRKFTSIQSSLYKNEGVKTTEYSCQKITSIKDKALEEASFLVWFGNENKITSFLNKNELTTHIKKSQFLEGSLEECFFNASEKVAYLNEKLLQSKKETPSSFDFFKQKLQAIQFSQLQKGSLLIHKKYGLGEFLEFKTLQVEGIKQDFLILVYKGGDRLLLPAYKSSEVKRYSVFHSFASKPPLHRLGNSQNWKRKVNETKKHIQNLSVELLKLYRIRHNSYRQPFKRDENRFSQFEKDFPFQETKAQKKALTEIMSDMDKPHPMNRLLCADVGFGKTEVGLRACFRALENNFQVCWLVPTTLLCLQHYENFKERFKNWPFEIRMLNRFLTSKEKTLLLENTKKGRVDFLIATHGVFQSNVDFKNLGFLVIDEEHRFGVKQKEKLLQFKKNLDVLSLTATPIPRTLNMALNGMKDISIIGEPPEGRKIIKSFFKKSQPSLIQQACEFEKKRDGQILFVHNRIKSIYKRKAELEKILPHFRIALATGQMNSALLEKTLLEFFNKEWDVLICTNIIESGMDLPSTNTLFIDNCDQMGLSQIYQLKGRIGRREKQAYCYYLFSEKPLSEKAKQRFNLLQQHEALGSGFHLALHDMETRGSGEIFGAEQSGHWNVIGQEFYFELLKKSLSGKEEGLESLEPELHFPFSTNISPSYLPDSHLRLFYYKALSEADSKEDLEQIEKEMEHNFGPFPLEVSNLFFLLQIKQRAQKLSIQQLHASSSSLLIKFSKQKPPSFESLSDKLKKIPWVLKGEYSIQIPLNASSPLLIKKELNRLFRHLESDSSA